MGLEEKSGGPIRVTALTPYEEARELVNGTIGLPGGAGLALHTVIESAKLRAENDTKETILADIDANDGLEIFCARDNRVKFLHSKIQTIIGG